MCEQTENKAGCNTKQWSRIEVDNRTIQHLAGKDHRSVEQERALFQGYRVPSLPFRTVVLCEMYVLLNVPGGVTLGAVWYVIPYFSW
jgi:hypothetical protein